MELLELFGNIYLELFRNIWNYSEIFGITWKYWEVLGHMLFGSTRIFFKCLEIKVEVGVHDFRPRFNLNSQRLELGPFHEYC